MASKRRIGMECRGCGQIFSGELGFNKHRVGSHSKRERRCLTVDEMLDKGLTRNDKGLWTTSIIDTDEVSSEQEKEGMEV